MWLLDLTPTRCSLVRQNLGWANAGLRIRGPLADSEKRRTLEPSHPTIFPLPDRLQQPGGGTTRLARRPMRDPTDAPGHRLAHRKQTSLHSYVCTRTS